MIVARSLGRMISRTMRSASFMDHVKEAVAVKPETQSAPKVREIFDTLRNINYRVDYPQGLSEEQKKNMKRFDIFR